MQITFHCGVILTSGCKNWKESQIGAVESCLEGSVWLWGVSEKERMCDVHCQGSQIWKKKWMGTLQFVFPAVCFSPACWWQVRICFLRPPCRIFRNNLEIKAVSEALLPWLGAEFQTEYLEFLCRMCSLQRIFLPTKLHYLFLYF